MNDDPDLVRRINNQLATIAENQARFDERQAQFDKRQAQFDNRQAGFVERQAEFDERQRRFDQNMAAMQEAIAGLIQVARLHNDQITALQQRDNEQGEKINALMRMIEGHLSNHP